MVGVDKVVEENDINKLFGSHAEMPKTSEESKIWKSELREAITEDMDKYMLQCRKNNQAALESGIYNQRF